MKLRDTAERLFWTVVAAALTNFGTANLFDLAAWEAAAMAALNGAATFVLLVARARLAVLPEPGAGLPGLPTDDGTPEVNQRLRELGIYDTERTTPERGQANVAGVLWVIFLLLAIIVLLRVLGVL